MSQDPSAQGFQVGGANADLFQSTAPFYAKYRRPYPAPVVSYLIEEFDLDGYGRLLDIGCGTGQVFQVMGNYFEEVIAIDSNTEMAQFAAQTAVKHDLRQTRLIAMRAEEIDEHLGSFRMAVLGASFHWMDRIQIGNLVYDRLIPGGHIVVLCPSDIHSGTTEWESEIRTLLEEWLGTERRAGQGTYRAGERHREVLRKTHFGEANETDIYVTEKWSMDQIIGYLFSTSYASKAVLGEKADGFERAVRERLLNLRPDGCFEKVNEYTAIWATRHG